LFHKSIAFWHLASVMPSFVQVLQTCSCKHAAVHLETCPVQQEYSFVVMNLLQHMLLKPFQKKVITISHIN
jgi:hypothetical protein